MWSVDYWWSVVRLLHCGTDDAAVMMRETRDESLFRAILSKVRAPVMTEVAGSF